MSTVPGGAPRQERTDVAGGLAPEPPRYAPGIAPGTPDPGGRAADTYTALDKGLWLTAEDVPESVLASGELGLFDGPFTYPVMVARKSALDANIATMAEYTRRHGVLFAPHGKTTMAPKLFAAQLAAGAWGITVATANQALAVRRFGVRRVLLANELLDGRALRWAAEQTRDGWEFLFYVDSPEGVAEAARAAAAVPGGRLSVLVELGRPGGRTGCRSHDAAVAVARAVAEADGLDLAGVAGYEGGLPDTDAVTAWMRELVAFGDAVADLVPASVGPPVVSAGGSSWFDAVVDVLGGLPGRRVLLRSGAYVSHDDGYYLRSTPFNRHPDEGGLAGALEVWAQVLSAPEPGLAVLGAGRRDVPFDLGLPVPADVRGTDGALRPAGDAVVVKLDDQHAYVETHGARLVPGETVRLLVSHPCTAFDKWRVVPVVDDDHRVVDLLRTYF
ncbi:alanine racemase [Yinghuangia seranimata]|uniref:alanine racemase n=1 Tax=Yinghuangia seranimata TaxID=408067 RepID=UPI00248CA554|nr:alanine racemase [Yinghuangia seranimata]MDI2132807.1 alanine racemase [Yinghuangia seranimata]